MTTRMNILLRQSDSIGAGVHEEMAIERRIGLECHSPFETSLEITLPVECQLA